MTSHRTQPGYRRDRVMIFGKTYPELSNRYTETVCTGAVDSSGKPVRLYPVPLRYMDSQAHYQLYDVIDVDTAYNPRDQRPESRKIDPKSIELLSNIATDKQEWAGRREWIFRDTDWHYSSMDTLRLANSERSASMAMIQLSEVVDVKSVEKSVDAKREFEKKWATISGQSDLFLSEYKELGFIPFEYRVLWRCLRLCETCKKRPHDTMVLDWGLAELGRKNHDWTLPVRKLEEISNLKTHDFRLFLGNLFTRPNIFCVIGMWYPKRSESGMLF